MKRLAATVMTVATLAMGLSAFADDLKSPIAASDLVFQEMDGIIAVEAEHFYKQIFTDKRAWYIISSKNAADIKPDADSSHVVGASGGAYLEVLPDTRANIRQQTFLLRSSFCGAPFLCCSGWAFSRCMPTQCRLLDSTSLSRPSLRGYA